MTLDLYQVDAFAEALFTGNPAAVCPLEDWLSDEVMQKIAAENNLAETAFFVPKGDHFHLRWFTPAVEVDLCGHATLATAHVLFKHLNFSGEEIRFQSRSGMLSVKKDGHKLVLDFPTDQIVQTEAPEALVRALRITPQEVWQGREDFLVVLENEAQLTQLQPDFRMLLQLGGRGVIATAPGNHYDFVSRCFFPIAGIDEDPVTGSAHTTLTPYWAKRLGKNQLEARQISTRGGNVSCELLGDRVKLSGRAVTYLQGKIFLQPINTATMHLSEILIHLGEERQHYFNAVSPPVIQSSNFAFTDLTAFRKAFTSELDNHVYTRGNNPTVAILRKKIAALEGAEDALVFGSGSGAIANAVISQVQSGDHIVCVESPYSWTKTLLEQFLSRFGVSHTFVDGREMANIENAIQSNTRLLYLESPNSLTFHIQDLEACAKLAKAKNITTIIDNSYASPIFQNPIQYGIDMVVHSATKYLNGHSDVVAGVVCGSKEKIRKIFSEEFMTLGGIISPHDAALMIRGLRTLEVRLKRSDESAQKIASFLSEHPKVDKVIRPLMPNFPQYELAKKQMSGTGGLFTVYFKAESQEKMEQFVHQINRFLIAVSWGGHESLIMPTIGFYHIPGRDDSPLPWNIIRFYIGLEDPDWLMEDLEQALKVLQMSREKKVIQMIPIVILLAGILVRLVVFLQNRSLFLDEANLALNIIEKNGKQFFQPLDYQQYAPPFFLLFEKANILVFGNEEMALRLLPFIAGLLGLYLFSLVIKQWLPIPYFRWFPLYLLAFSPMLIQFSTEVKQYSTDVLTNIFFIYLAVRWPYQHLTLNRKLGWIVLGMAAIWWSMPVVFVLFGVGCYYGFQAFREKRFAGVISLIPIPFFWLMSFAFYYYAILSIDLDKAYLVDYHRPYFLPILPLSAESWQRWLNVWSVFVKISLGGTIIAYVLGGILAFLGLRPLFLQHPDRLVLILCPVISCLFASALEQYSLMPRLALFLTPNVMLILGIGFSQCWLLLNSKWLKLLFVVPIIIILINWNGYRYFIEKMELEDSREVLAFAAKASSADNFIYISHELIPAYRYYGEYHPQQSEFQFDHPYLAKWNDKPAAVLEHEAFPERATLLFSHLVSREARGRLEQQIGSLEHYEVEKNFSPIGAAGYILLKK